jgi:hypothetical protein
MYPQALGLRSDRGIAMPALRNATIKFHTNDDDKDNDTHVTVVVRDANQVVAARVDNDFGHFDDHSDSGPFALVVQNPSTRDSLQSGSLTIRIDPNGHDTWKFNLFLMLEFNDGSHLSGGADGLALNQNSREQTFGLDGIVRLTAGPPGQQPTV